MLAFSNQLRRSRQSTNVSDPLLDRADLVTKTPLEGGALVVALLLVYARQPNLPTLRAR